MFSRKFNVLVAKGLVATGRLHQLSAMRSFISQGDVFLQQIADEYEYSNARIRNELRRENAKYLKKAAKVFEKIKFKDQDGNKVENPGFFDKEKGGISEAARNLLSGKSPKV